MIELTEIQKDGIKEALNISIGKAASTFNSMIHEHIDLTVPELNFVLNTEALRVLSLDPGKEVCYIMQKFKGSFFKSDAMLVFAQDESMELVKLFLGEETPMMELATLEREAMSEIGNIILNSVIGSLSNLLQDRITGSFPVFKKCKADFLFRDESRSEDEVLLMVYVDFRIESKEIQGYIVLVLEMDSFVQFKEQLIQNLIQ